MFTVALAACSTIKIAYNHAATAGYWWLDGYVDFSQAQSLQLRADLAQLEVWHRTAELPRYVDLLQKVERLTTADIGAGQVCAIAQQMLERLDAIAAQIEPATASLAMTLTPAELQGVDRKYAMTNARYRKEWLSRTPEEQLDTRYKQWLARTEMIYGRLDAAQKDSLRRQLALSSFDPRTSYEERLRRQQDALQTLHQVTQAGLSQGDARNLVHGYLERTLGSPNPEYRVYQHTLLLEGCRTVALMHNTTTTTQRELAGQRLRGYERDLVELSSQQR